MAIYKCKMCGGDLEVEQGVTVIECEYCGTKQTVPTSNDEEIRNLFNRANLLRRKCEFDKAEEIYEKILEKDDKQSEAYWCVLLCRYGIEYVEDPKTFKRVPTCHRTSFEAITSDEYYKLALKNADPVQKKIYTEEAKYIDGVQKEILAISQKEDPYDVFICYKETDENGKRTEDSVIANDIYYQLTQAGYKVFYAAITLEDKLGSAYEPIIFAALHSSKVMLAIGTKPEHFNAVWVKNEWSRFLKLMKTDKTKQLIPCYRGMDAYELPEEFAHLQAQDMGKIGFINDLVRGIKKIIPKEEPKKETVKDTGATAGATAGVKSLLQRMNLFLEDGDWDRAKEYAEKVLDIDPENAEAYLGELLAELEITKFENLQKHPEPIKNLPLFQKAYRFADKEFKAKLDDIIEKNKNFRENKRLEGIYSEASMKEKTARSESDFLKAAEIFESITYKNSADCAKRCREKAEQAKEAAVRRAKEEKEEAARRAKIAEQQRKDRIYWGARTDLSSGEMEKVMNAKKAFVSVRSYLDSEKWIEECEEEIERLRLAKKEEIYTRACKALLTRSAGAIGTARKDFEVLGDYKDSEQKIIECDEQLAQLKETAEKEKRAQQAAAAKRKKMKIALIITAVILVVAIIITTAIVTTVNDKKARAGLTYTAYGNVYMVSGIEDETMENIVIPETYRGRPVEYIAAGAFKNSTMKSITIPKTIKKIKCDAFSSCANLQNAYFADPEGWSIYRHTSGDWYFDFAGSFTVDEMSDPATAARRLVSYANSHTRYEWEKS